MLIEGHFGELGRPRVAVRVVFSRLGKDAQLGIAERGSSTVLQFPSLLGRDILDKARTVVDPAGCELSLDFGTGLAW